MRDFTANDEYSVIASRLAGAYEMLESVADMPLATDVMALQIERHPDQIDKRLFKARLHYRRGELDAAAVSAQSVLDQPDAQTSFMAQLQYELRRRAASLGVDIATRRWDAAPADEKLEWIDRIVEAREKLEGYVADPEGHPLCVRARGKEAFARASYAQAAALLASR